MATTMELFRSEEMQLIQIIVPAEAAHATVTALAEVGLVQFRDLNPDRSAFHRTYANQVKRCDEMLRKLRFFGEQTHKAGLVNVPRSDLEDRSGTDLDELEHKMDLLEGELLSITKNTDSLKKAHSELVELQLVLEKAGGFFQDARVRDASQGLGGSSGRASSASKMQISGGSGLLGGATGRDTEIGESLLGAYLQLNTFRLCDDCTVRSTGQLPTPIPDTHGLTRLTLSLKHQGGDTNANHSRSNSRSFSEYEQPERHVQDPHAVRLGFITATVRAFPI